MIEKFGTVTITDGKVLVADFWFRDVANLDEAMQLVIGECMKRLQEQQWLPKGEL